MVKWHSPSDYELYEEEEGFRARREEDLSFISTTYGKEASRDRIATNIDPGRLRFEEGSVIVQGVREGDLLCFLDHFNRYSIPDPHGRDSYRFRIIVVREGKWVKWTSPSTVFRVSWLQLCREVVFADGTTLIDPPSGWPGWSEDNRIRVNSQELCDILAGRVVYRDLLERKEQEKIRADLERVTAENQRLRIVIGQAAQGLSQTRSVIKSGKIRDIRLMLEAVLK